MDAPAYDKLLGLLDAVQLTLASNAGNLTSADLRIRCLVNITAKEAQRALLETGVNCRAGRSPDDAQAPAVEGGLPALSEPTSLL